MKHKILHLIESSEAGGAENIFSNTIRFLNTDRYVSVAGISGDGLWLQAQLSDLNIKTVKFIRKKPLDITFLKTLIRFIKKENFSLIHSHMFTMNFYAALSSVITKCPLVCTMHDTFYDLSTTKRILAYKFISTFSDFLVTVSPDMYTQVSDIISNVSKIKCILNGVVLPEPSHSDKAKLRARQNIGTNELIILNVGNLYQVKNHSLLVNIAKHFYPHREDFRLIIIGEGPLRSHLEARIKESSLEDKVILLGLRTDVQYWLSVADIFILPSLSEGLSISILEAMSHALPVIASNTGGNKDIIAQNTNGILVGHQVPDSYVEHLVRLDSDITFRDYLGRNALETIRKRFNIRVMVKNYQSLYEECIKCDS